MRTLALRLLRDLSRALIALLVLAGCGGDPVETIVCIGAEPQVRARARRIEIRVEDSSGQTSYQRTEDTTGLRWPIGLPFTPKDEPGAFRVFVSFEDETDAVFATKIIAGDYAGDDRLMVIDATVESACIDVLGCPADQTCVSGACAPVPVPVLHAAAERSIEGACPLDCSFDLPVNPGMPLNSAENDPPALPSFDGSEIYTVRTAPAGDADIYVAERIGPLEYSTPVPVANVNSSARDNPGRISNDGLTLYFNSDRAGSRRLYTATRPTTAAPFEAPAELAIDGADALVIVGGPSLSSDELSLFVTAGTDPDLDVYMANRESVEAPFGALTRVEGIRTDGSERELTVGPDGRVFYQGSPPGAERAHIFTADFDLGARTFTNPRAWEYSNPGFGEYFPHLSGDGRELWVGIHTSAGLGIIDVFVSRRACVP
jgi:hypothetical protein